MLKTIANFAEFERDWGDVHNLLLAGECQPFAFDLPPLERIIDEVRRDQAVLVTRGYSEPFVHHRQQDITADFRKLPLERAMATPFSMVHYEIGRFDQPGGLLDGLAEQVLRPWRRALEDHGFTLTEFFKPYFFISGPGCTTPYHMDFSHVLAWQRYGVKRFCSLRNPDRFAGPDVRRSQLDMGGNAFAIPIPVVTDDDVVEAVMTPGTLLWNVLQTPHWVIGGPDVSLSLNISHRGLRHHGRLCPHEQELEQWKLARAAAAPDQESKQ